VSGLDAVLVDLLTTLSNASLDLDPLAKARLSALEGTRVQFEIKLPTPVDDKNLLLRIADSRLEFSPGPDEPTGEAAPHGANGQPHAIVRGSIPSVLAWLTGSGTGSDTLTFEGDEAVLAELSGILTNYQPDLAEPLSRLLGGDAAESLISAAEMALATFRSMLESASSAAQHSAGRSFVSTPKLDTLLTGLDALQLRTDRLAAKVRAAEAARTAERSSERAEDLQ